MAETTTLRAEPRDRGPERGPPGAARRSGPRAGCPLWRGHEAGDPDHPDPRALGRRGCPARLLCLVWSMSRSNGTTHRTLPRDVQLDPMTDYPIHVDFLRVSAGTKITVAVPVKFTDAETSPGIRRGGMLNIARHAIDLVCPVENIPDVLTISLEGMEIGDSIHITAVKLPEGTRPTITRNFTVASIAAPTAVREEQVAAIAAAKAAEAAAAAPAEGEAAAGAAPAGGAAPAAGAAAPAAGAKPAAKG